MLDCCGNTDIGRLQDAEANARRVVHYRHPAREIWRSELDAYRQVRRSGRVK